MTPMMLPAITSGTMPMSSRRGIAPTAEFVCRVEYTWWPVIAARNAISAVAHLADQDLVGILPHHRANAVGEIQLRRLGYRGLADQRHRILDWVFQGHD